MPRKLLGRVEIDEQLEAEFDRSGMLDVFFADRSDAHVTSDDGNRTVAWLAPSGGIAALLVQDYANGESRSIPFTFGNIEIENDGAEITIFLVTKDPAVATGASPK